MLVRRSARFPGNDLGASGGRDRNGGGALERDGIDQWLATSTVAGGGAGFQDLRVGGIDADRQRRSLLQDADRPNDRAEFLRLVHTELIHIEVEEVGAGGGLFLGHGGHIGDTGLAVGRLAVERLPHGDGHVPDFAVLPFLAAHDGFGNRQVARLASGLENQGAATVRKFSDEFTRGHPHACAVDVLANNDVFAFHVRKYAASRRQEQGRRCEKLV